MTKVDRTRLPSPVDDPPIRFPAFNRVRLGAGLELRVATRRALPIVAFHVLVRAGSADDPEELPGLAALTGDMLDEGSGDRSAIDLHESLARIGAEFDTDVSADATVLSLTTISRHAETGLDLLADMVVRPRLADADVDRVREHRLNRLRQLRDVPSAVADRTLLRLLYGEHPYGHTPLGSADALQRITVDEVRAFHGRAYSPSRATVIAVGDTDIAALEPAVRRAFDGWADRPGAAAASSRHAPPGRAIVGLVDRAGAAQSELRIGQIGPARATPDYHALLVLNMVLGGQFVSRVNLNLRERKGYTYGARTGFDFRRGPGPFSLQTSVETRVTADALVEALGEIRRIRDEAPPTAAELDMARAALCRGYARNFETVGQIARASLQQVLYDLADDYFDRFVPTVAAVDASAVERVAREHLDPARLTTLVVGDRRAVEPALVAAGFDAPLALAPA